MGSNSNRSETREEKLSGYAKQIFNTRDISDSKFQTSTGAAIRGQLGIEKGNQFIKDIQKYR